MKLEEKHKEFVIKHFARFMKLTDIVDAFMEEFEEDLPQIELEEIPDLDELIAEPLEAEFLQEKYDFIEAFIEEHKEEYQEIYGDEAKQELDAEALTAFEQKHRLNCIEVVKFFSDAAESDLIAHKKEIRENLFNRFRRLNINHSQFPKKYRTLFQKTRNEYCENYRIQSLNNPQNLATELETLYGYQKQLIFQGGSPKEVTKYLNAAHQILKTVLAHNALNANQQGEDITPQDVKPLEEAQKALPEPPKAESQKALPEPPKADS